MAMDKVILDSGDRTVFETGAVRDMQKGKGRCDLLPLDVVTAYFDNIGIGDKCLAAIERFQAHGDTNYLLDALESFCTLRWQHNHVTMFLEVSKHFEAGAEKYGERNWQKGLPANCYINSAVRHYFKFSRGDEDEAHDLAFVWNLMACVWTCTNKPELNSYAGKKCLVCGCTIPTGKKECPNCRVFAGIPGDDFEFMGEYEEENYG